MKKDLKKMAFFSLIAGAFCLSAQEAGVDHNEISMSNVQDDCRDSLILPEGRSRPDDYDYDVYTVGEERNDSGNCGKAPKRTQCNKNKSIRKGAAKVAQE